ncbi:MAG TPA: hypothetical protein VHZ75_09870 [Solirubrobacteraceae bacterium]|jgi:hypothetical protein|nr:hypothetical protein [Solirubrobacteraceae bacterium]
MTPGFAGFPDPVRLSDWLLVEWVATAKRGDAFPDPWCHAHSPLKSMIDALVELSVMRQPPPDASVKEIAAEATAAAQAWLQTHPRPDPAPVRERRTVERGRKYGI